MQKIVAMTHRQILCRPTGRTGERPIPIWKRESTAVASTLAWGATAVLPAFQRRSSAGSCLAARFTADTTALSDAVVMDESIPTPQTT
jgi:hypothetical protein